MRSHTSCRPARRRQGASDPGAKHLCLAKSDQDRGGSLWSVSSAGRAVGFYPTGRGFDSSTLCPRDPSGRAPYPEFWGMSSSGRAPGSDPEGWRFEPSMSRTPKYANRNSGLLQVQVCAGSTPAFGIAIARGAVWRGGRSRARVARPAGRCCRCWLQKEQEGRALLFTTDRYVGDIPTTIFIVNPRENQLQARLSSRRLPRREREAPRCQVVMFLRGFPLRGPGRAWEPAKTTPRCWPPPARA